MKKVYLVIRGNTPGVYTDYKEWEKSTMGFSKCLTKSFINEEDAVKWWLANDVRHVLTEKDIHNAFHGESVSKPVPIVTEITRRPLKIYTDASIMADGKVGGWAGVLISQDKERMLIKGSKKNVGDNSCYMELFALLKTLKKIKKNGWNLNDAYVYTDSKYIADRYMMNHIPKDLNKKIWKKIWKLIVKYNITISWVRGHADDEYNILCDRMARNAAKERMKKINKKKRNKNVA